MFNDEVVAELRLSTPKRESIVGQCVLADREGCELLDECTSPAVKSATLCGGRKPREEAASCNDACMRSTRSAGDASSVRDAGLGSV